MLENEDARIVLEICLGARGLDSLSKQTLTSPVILHQRILKLESEKIVGVAEKDGVESYSVDFIRFYWAFVDTLKMRWLMFLNGTLGADKNLKKIEG